jgi:hypothetical protein
LASGASGNKASTTFGHFDYWIVHLDDTGNYVWDRTFGGSDWDLGYDVQQTLDGGFILAGNSKSAAGGNKSSPLLHSSDAWLIRLDPSGQKLWEQTYDGIHQIGPARLCQTRDGGYLLSAGFDSVDRGYELIVMKLSTDPVLMPQLSTVLRPAVSGFALELSGLSNRTYVTEFSTDLQNWSPLVTNQLTSGSVELLDGRPEAGRRFYRARMME